MSQEPKSSKPPRKQQGPLSAAEPTKKDGSTYHIKKAIPDRVIFAAQAALEESQRLRLESLFDPALIVNSWRTAARS